MRRLGGCAAGDMPHRLIVKNPTAAQDPDYGSSAPTFARVKKIWGSVEPLSGRELIAAQAVEAQTTHRIKTRYHSAITSKSRIVHKGRTLELTMPPLNILERNEQMHLMCKEVE